MINALEITSKTNNIIKKAVQLQGSARRRSLDGQFVIEGLRLCKDAFCTGVDIDILMVTRQAFLKNEDVLFEISKKARLSFFITQDISLKLGETKSPQGIFCICGFPERNRFEISKTGRYIFLESINNPSNLGAIIRTAEALGIDGAVLSDGCCDIYNQKVLRAAMGSALRLPFMFADDMTGMTADLTQEGFLTVASVPDQSACDITEIDLSCGCVVVIGNEAAGISDALKKACKVRATVPMGGRAESLNAATAGTIIMWEMMRK